jgi:hypothetical protein
VDLLPLFFVSTVLPKLNDKPRDEELALDSNEFVDALCRIASVVSGPDTTGLFGAGSGNERDNFPETFGFRSSPESSTSELCLRLRFPVLALELPCELSARTGSDKDNVPEDGWRGSALAAMATRSAFDLRPRFFFSVTGSLPSPSSPP